MLHNDFLPLSLKNRLRNIFTLQVYVDTLVNKAYENWNQVVEYDGKSLLSSKQSKKSNASRNDFQGGHLDLSNTLDHGSIPRMPVSVQPQQPVMDSGLSVAGNHSIIVIKLLDCRIFFIIINDYYLWEGIRLVVVKS